MFGLKPYIYIIILALLVACQPNAADTPDVLSPSKMEDILYDYHILQSIAAQQFDADSTQEAENKRRLANLNTQLYAKHRTTEREFNHSLEYYSRHIDQFYDIYDHLTTRLQENASNANLSTLNPQPSTEDTLLLWQAPRPLLLSATAQNRVIQTLKIAEAKPKAEEENTFHLSPFTFHLKEGDRLSLSFQTLWLYQSGSKTANAQIALRYQGDSIASFTRQIHSTGPQEVTITVQQRPLQQITLLIYQNAAPAPKPRFLLISNLALRATRRATLPADTLRADSLRVDSLAADSLSTVNRQLSTEKRPTRVPANAKPIDVR